MIEQEQGLEKFEEGIRPIYSRLEETAIESQEGLDTARKFMAEIKANRPASFP